MKKLIIPFLFFYSFFNYAQNDCVDAIVVCGNSGYEDLQAVGVGTQELSGSNTCGSVENNSIWFNIKVNTGGTLGFTLTPTFANGNPNTDINIDFDFFVFGPDVNCGAIGQAIRCSTTNPSAAGQGNNLTGMNGTESDTSEGPGAGGNSFVSWLNVTAGESYFLVIDRPVGNSNFRIDWNGTATFNEPPTAEAPPIGVTYNLEECDSDGVPDNATEFDLTVNSAPLIGTQTDVVVNYYTSNTAAQVGSGGIFNPNAFTNTSDPQTIYVRISNVNTECFVVTDFEIDVIGSLIISAPNIEICDDNNDGLWDFDLTQNDVAILNGQTGLIVSYHENQNDALNDVSPIVGLYQNTSNSQMLWARIDDPIGGCFGVDDFRIEVFNTPVALTAPTMVLCDDDNNGTMPFMLTDQDGLINTDAGMTISYHPNQADANANTNPLPSPFESGNTTIFTRVENDLNTTCFTTSSFGLEVYDSAFPLGATNIANRSFCDDFTVGLDNDGFIIFDLTQLENTILNGQSSSGFTLTYFTDAGYTSLIGTPTTFTNTVVGGQTIYVRMTNNLSAACFSDTSFEIEVFELPILNTPPFVLEQCDDDFDGFNIFNLTEINSDIVSNITTEIFTYHESSANATSGASPIPNPTTYTNIDANVDTNVWVRIENNNGCFRTTQIELIVKPSAIPTTFLEEFYACDDGTDTTDGIATFDFSSVTAQIEAIFPLAIDVYYYENEADATSEVNEILDPSNHQNTNSTGVQEIWVRADSQLGNDCLGNGHHVTLFVNSLPQFEVDPEVIVCLNLPPITLETFNPYDVYSYVWTDENNTIISNDPTASVSVGGVYTVVGSFTYPDGTVCQSEPRTITVSESIIAAIDIDDVTIVDDSDNNTITINNIGTNLGIGDYEFALDDGNGGIGFYQDEPFFENVAPGIRTIYVQDKNNCGVAELEVAVIGFPKFFTPNNDGENDTWQIKGVGENFFSSSLIYIYDRYGKMIAKVDPTTLGWDGYYNGESLPSTDYWFTAELIDQNGNIRNRKGHFSLVRR